MRFVSYNIRLALDSSLDRIASVLRDLDGDVVCLQEVGRFWRMGDCVDMTAVIAQLSGYPHAYYGGAIQDGSGEYGIALLSRVEFKDVEKRFLPQNVDEPRILVTATLENGNTPIQLATSHISVKPEDRPQQCRQVAEWLGDSTNHTVLMGDLNAELQSPELTDLTISTGLRCALLESIGEHGPSYPTEQPRLAIDHILIGSGLSCIASCVENVDGSDHIPVWADVEVN